MQDEHEFCYIRWDVTLPDHDLDLLARIDLLCHAPKNMQ